MADPVAELVARLAALERRVSELERLDLPRFGKSAALIYRSSSQSIPNRVWTYVAFNSVAFDTDGMTASGSDRLVINTPGFYVVGLSAQFAANSTGTRGLNILVNGSEIAMHLQNALTAAGYDKPFLTFAPAMQYDAGDVIRARVFQESGGALNLIYSSTAPYRTALWAILVYGTP